MIIVTGPKESGKTTLINQLRGDLDIETKSPFSNPQYYKAQAIQGRPRKGFEMKAVEDDTSDLMEKVLEDLDKWPESGTCIYEGYPLIEEYIYGPLNRGGYVRGFDSHAIKPVLAFFWAKSLIIYCRPTTDLLSDPTVDYYDFILRPPLSSARVVRYDYNSPQHYSYVRSRVLAHHQERLREYGLDA